MPAKSKARREELNNIDIKVKYLDKLQKQAKLFQDSEVKVLYDSGSPYYGPDLPF